MYSILPESQRTLLRKEGTSIPMRYLDLRREIETDVGQLEKVLIILSDCEQDAHASYVVIKQHNLKSLTIVQCWKFSSFRLDDIRILASVSIDGIVSAISIVPAVSGVVPTVSVVLAVAAITARIVAIVAVARAVVVVIIVVATGSGQSQQTGEQNHQLRKKWEIQPFRCY